MTEGLASRYWSAVQGFQAQIVETQSDAIRAAAGILAEAIQSDMLVHVFGSGHSMVFAKEMFNRSGGLVQVSPIFDANLTGVSGGSRKVARLEQLEGYGRFALEDHDYRAGEPVVIFSAAGRNPVSIDVASAFHDSQGKVIGVTSLAYSNAFAPRHSSGQRLADVADVVIDNIGEVGDGAIDLPGAPGLGRVGPTSTITGMLIAELMVMETIDIITNSGRLPRIVVSGNVDGAREANRAIFESFIPRLRHY